MLLNKASETEEVIRETTGFWKQFLERETWYLVIDRIIAVALIVGVILLIGFILRKMVAAFFSRSKKRSKNTLAPVFDNAIQYLMYFVIIISVLDQFGIPTSSILTVAGVGSIAIGFGAQSLVKDVVTGIFIIAEEQFQVDDIISVNGKQGRVETIGLRTTTFRNVVNDEVYIIPNGEIDMVTNLTKGPHKAVVYVEIPFEPDLDTVLKVLQKAMDNFDGGEDILSQPVVQGITDFVESAMQVRIVCDCKSGRAWHIERELRRTIKYSIEAEGIYIPYSTRTLHIVEPDEKTSA